MEQYRLALDGAIADRKANDITGPIAPKFGTYRWLCMLYFSSGEYRQLAPQTRKTRRRILELTWDEPIEPESKTLFADFPLQRMTTKAIRVLRDRKADYPAAANNRLKAIRQVFSYGLQAEPDLVKINPVRDVPKLRISGNGFHSWEISEVEQFEEHHPIGTKARLALALLLYTGQRRSDIVQFGRQHIRDGWLKFTQHKNRNKNPVTLEIPVHPDLSNIIEASPVGDLTFLVTDYGQPFTSNGFGNRFRKWCDEAGLSQCSAHGLRKAMSTRLAESGASDRQIMAVTGHKTSKEVDRYVRAAQQKVLAKSAIPLLTKADKDRK
ncbi:tyrosine-type recombinase/integrase [Pseudochelatococcus sp. G4_1912]|uniref:tyrosine-type recombinase/integrase n=1 Tax=Pseudochelatococcus sp. G4_1912 TaxID=3114288 RepID=UPI0039C6122F